MHSGGSKKAAYNASAIIGIGKDRIVVLSVGDKEKSTAQTASVLTDSDNNTTVTGLKFYSWQLGAGPDLLFKLYISLKAIKNCRSNKYFPQIYLPNPI